MKNSQGEVFNLKTFDINYIIKNNKCLIIGDNGTGKTTFLMQIFEFIKSKEEYLPILIKLEVNDDYDLSIIKLKLNEYKDQHPDDFERLIILIDDLDYINNASKQIIDEILKNNDLRVIITANSQHIVKFLSGYTVYSILPLESIEIYSIIETLDKKFNKSNFLVFKEILESNSNLIAYLYSPLMVNFIYNYIDMYKENLSFDEFNKIESNQLSYYIKKDTLKPQLIFDQKHSIDLKKSTYKAEKDDLVILPPYVGIGDILWHTHIPKIAKDSNRFNRILVSEAAKYVDLDYKYLFWENNPYIDGYAYCDENCKDAALKKALESYNLAEKQVNTENNLLDCIMLSYGLDDNKRFHEPELYYKPVVIDQLKGKTLYDPNFHTDSRINLVDYFNVERFFNIFDIQIDYQMSPLGNFKPYNPVDFKWLSYNSILIRRFGSFLRTSTLMNFIDVLYSVENVYCLTTGTSIICNALRKRANVILGTKLLSCHHSKLNNYINISS